MSDCNKCIHKEDKCFCPPDKECKAFEKEKVYIEKIFKFNVTDDWVPCEAACWSECPFSAMIPFGASCRYIEHGIKCPLKRCVDEQSNR